MSVYVCGHSNPDTDSVAAAIGYATLAKALGEDAVAVMQSSADALNPESKVVLERFGWNSTHLEDRLGTPAL